MEGNLGHTKPPPATEIMDILWSCLNRFSPLLSCFRLVLRIRADDPNAVCQLGVKFGCSLSDGRELLNTAKDLGLNVVGIR